MIFETGNPKANGIYAVRQWYAWRILEWHDGAWWHVGRVAKWPLGNPRHAENDLEGFIGPLPMGAKDYSVKPKAELEFDL